MIEFKDLDWEDKTLELNAIIEKDGVKVITVTKIIKNIDYDGSNDIRPYVNVVIAELKVPFLFEYYIKEMMWYAAKTSKEYTQKQMRISLGLDSSGIIDDIINNFDTEYNKIKRIKADAIYKN